VIHALVIIIVIVMTLKPWERLLLLISATSGLASLMDFAVGLVLHERFAIIHVFVAIPFWCGALALLVIAKRRIERGQTR
jgi:hypothetical protein